MAKTNISSTVTALILPTVEELGYSLWDVEFEKIGADWNLTVTIDSSAGITINDCEKVHGAIDPILDQADPIEVSYILNVSSPGIERELRTEKHISLCLGEKCEAKLFTSLNGTKVIKGVLQDFKDGIVFIQTTAGVVECPKTAISKLRTVYFD